jgi:uncharacterized protein (DUF3820 family)
MIGSRLTLIQLFAKTFQSKLLFVGIIKAKFLTWFLRLIFPAQNLGEALAAHLAILLASSLRLKTFILEGDSQTVILALQ